MDPKIERISAEIRRLRVLATCGLRVETPLGDLIAQRDNLVRSKDRANKGEK